jgi:hypothetical protein
MADVKRKRKFNIVDLALVLIIAAVVVAAVFVGNKLLGNGGSVAAGADSITIEFSIQFKEIPDSGTGNLTVGDVVREANSKTPIGQVEEIFFEPYSELVYVDGEQAGGVMAEKDGYVNMLVTLRAQATHDERGYYVNGIKILVGQQLEVWSPGYSSQGWCMEIREVR